MNMEWKTLAPEGRPCLAARVGTHGPAFYWFVSEREAARAQELCRAAAEAVQSPCLLALCVVKDWDRELSPWAAPAAFRGGEDFAGGGASTLKWLQTVCLPAAEEGWQTTARFLCGYSLAGLFCLWGYYESGGAFGGAACCSGSLWYPGWEEYAARRAVFPGGRLYLSLGETEERARNPVLSKVGDAVRAQFARIQADPNTACCALQWHPGGHFDHPAERTAEGLLWLMRADHCKRRSTKDRPAG